MHHAYACVLTPGWLQRQLGFAVTAARASQGVSWEGARTNLGATRCQVAVGRTPEPCMPINARAGSRPLQRVALPSWLQPLPRKQGRRPRSGAPTALVWEGSPICHTTDTLSQSLALSPQHTHKGVIAQRVSTVKVSQGCRQKHKCISVPRSEGVLTEQRVAVPITQCSTRCSCAAATATTAAAGAAAGAATAAAPPVVQPAETR